MGGIANIFIENMGVYVIPYPLSLIGGLYTLAFDGG
jgi:hypothetical protein